MGKTFLEKCSEPSIVGSATRLPAAVVGSEWGGQPAAPLRSFNGTGGTPSNRTKQAKSRYRNFSDAAAMGETPWRRRRGRERERERERPPEALGRGSGCGGMGAQNHEMVRNFLHFLKNAPRVRILHFRRISLSPRFRSGPCHYFNGVAGAIA